MVNIGNMMKQAQELQKKMAEAQNKLNEIVIINVKLIRYPIRINR